MNEPITHGEFFAWVKETFNPHLEDEKDAHSKVTRLSIAVFGDGNGNAGIHKHVKELVILSNRVNTWLDGIIAIGKIFGWAAVTASAIIIALEAAKKMGWL